MRNNSVGHRLKIRCLALPDYHYPPAEFVQGCLVAPVPNNVGFEFLLPVLRPSLGVRGMLAARMPVPEAPMNHDYGAVSGEHDVRRARKILPVKAEAEAEAVCDAPYDHLGPGVPPADTGHDLASLRTVEDVRHFIGIQVEAQRG